MRMNQDRSRSYRWMAAGLSIAGGFFAFAGFRITPAVLWWALGGISLFGGVVLATGSLLPPPEIREVPPDELAAAAMRKARNWVDIVVLAVLALLWMVGWCQSGRLDWPHHFP